MVRAEWSGLPKLHNLQWASDDIPLYKVNRVTDLLSTVGGHVETHEGDTSDQDTRQDQVENLQLISLNLI